MINCEAICPAMSHVLINTYRSNSWLFVDGKSMLSKEGTTQGDPLVMAMYAIGTQPLIHRLDGVAKQVWYANDSAAVGSSLERLRRWWDLLKMVGPLYGYFHNGSKTHVLTKLQHPQAVKEIFKDTNNSINRGRTLSRWSNGHFHFSTTICGEKSGWMGEGTRITEQVCSNTTTYSLHCLHSWPLFKVELSSLSH